MDNDRMDAPLLFLDFDGVLHPGGATREQLFCRMPLLADALRGPLAGVDIVISSDWRLVYDITALRQHFPADVQGRVLGCTPLDTQVTPRTWGAMAVNYPRQAQVMAWITRHRASPRHPWVALDDRPEWFLPGESRLVVVPRELGLQPEHLAMVADVLRQQPVDGQALPHSKASRRGPSGRVWPAHRGQRQEHGPGLPLDEFTNANIAYGEPPERPAALRSEVPSVLSPG